MKKYIIVAILIFTPITASAAFTTNLYYGKEEKPKSCPGTLRHNVQLFGESVTSTTNTVFSTSGTISSSMTFAQRRVNEVEHCNLNEKQSEKVVKNHEKQYEKTEKKIEKAKNKDALTTKVAEQNLAQTKKLTELSSRNSQKSKLADRMIINGTRRTENIIGKIKKDNLDSFRAKTAEVKNLAKEKFAPKKPLNPTPPKTPTTPAPVTKDEDDDCLPGETEAQCNEEDWDGKYYSAEEYERANGLR